MARSVIQVRSQWHMLWCAVTELSQSFYGSISTVRITFFVNLVTDTSASNKSQQRRSISNKLQHIRINKADPLFYQCLRSMVTSPFNRIPSTYYPKRNAHSSTSDIVQRLGYVAFTHKTRVRTSVSEDHISSFRNYVFAYLVRLYFGWVR